MGTGIQARPQAPAFEVTNMVARQNGFLNPGAATPTPRNQERIGARQTPIQAHNTTVRAPAGFHTNVEPIITSSTRTASIQHSAVSARHVVGRNYASKKGSGSNNHPKPIAGTDDVFNVGGTGGRSAILVKVPNTTNTATHAGQVATRKAYGGASPKNDPTKAPLTAVASVPVHIGFNHVGYR